MLGDAWGKHHQHLALVSTTQMGSTSLETGARMRSTRASTRVLMSACDVGMEAPEAMGGAVLM